MLAPMFDVRREDPCSLALTLRPVRRLRGIKQAHAGELLGVTQSTVRRIERGELKPAGASRNRLLDFVVARIDPSRDAALRHLVEGSASPVHLVCDFTHRLLTASGPREREWRRAANELQCQSLWRYASEGIRSAEARLPDLGWGERDGSHALSFVTEANGSDELRIVPGVTRRSGKDRSSEQSVRGRRNGYRSTKSKGKSNFTIADLCLCRSHFCDSRF